MKKVECQGNVTVKRELREYIISFAYNDDKGQLNLSFKAVRTNKMCALYIESLRREDPDMAVILSVCDVTAK